MAQAKLLRVLEERRFERLGGKKSIEVDFRLISATNRPLDQFVRDSRFREDLYYRVNAFAIRLPSLRERPVDIPVLANRFVARYCAANGLPLDAKVFAEGGRRDAADAIPGRATSASSKAPSRAPRCRRPDASSATATSSSCTRTRRRPKPRGSGCRRSRRRARAHPARARAVPWNKKEAAGVLEISRGTLYRKIVEYGLESERARLETEHDTADVDRRDTQSYLWTHT